MTVDEMVPDTNWDYYMRTHGPCPITTTGCVEALQDGRIDYDENMNLRFRFDRLHEVSSDVLAEGYELLQAWLDSPRGGLDMGSRGGRDEVLQLDAIGTSAIRFAVAKLGLRTTSALARWLGCDEGYIRPSWIQQAVCDHMVRDGAPNGDIIAELKGLGFDGSNKNYVAQRRRRCSQADGVDYPSVPRSTR